MIPNHVLWGKILQAEDIVLADELGGQLVQHIPTLVGNALMEPSYLASGLLPVAAPL